MCDIIFRKEKYNFSIIIPFHNSEQFIKDSIESVLNQTAYYKNTVQIVLVDDNSLDHSRDIISEIKNDYEDNIILVENEGEGIADARNTGLKYADGKYVNFLDSDDWLCENALEEVYRFFEKNYFDIDVVAIPMCYFEDMEGEDKLNYKFKDSEIINLKLTPNNPQISINSTFIKKEAIGESRFDNNLVCSEDTLFLNKIILEKMSYGVLNTTRYFYRKHRNMLGYSDSLNYTTEYYTPRMKNYHLKLIRYCLDKFNTVPRYIQYLLVLDMAEVVKQPNLDMFKYQDISSYEYAMFADFDEITDDEGILNFKKAVYTIMEYIDDVAILRNKNIDDDLIKHFLLYLKHGFNLECINFNRALLKCEDTVIDDLGSNPLWIGKMTVSNDSLKIHGFFSSHFHKEDLILELVMKDENNQESAYTAKLFEHQTRENVTFLSYTMLEHFEFKFNIPLNDVKKAKFKIRFKPKKYQNVLVNVESGFYNEADPLNKGSVFAGGYKFTYDGSCFTLDKSFKIAVVMAIYNTEDLLVEAVDSVINQTLDFKENIQLILVDDGSEDDSLKICKEYQAKYPENIVVLSQENSGQATARNNGIKYANARYLNFLDSDDYFSHDAFESVYNFFINHDHETDIVSIPIRFFGRFEDDHPLNFKYHHGDRVINLNNDQYNPQYHANSAFFNANALNEIQFPLDVMPSEDSVLINKILLKKRTLGVVEKGLYYYRKREDGTSSLDLTHDKEEYFTMRLKKYFLGLINYAMNTYGEVPKFLEYTIAHDLHWMLFEPEIAFTESQIEIDEFHEYLHQVISHISVDTINNLSIENDILKSYFLYLKEGGSYIDLHDGLISLRVGPKEIDRVNYHRLWLDIVELNKNHLDISGLYMGLIENRHLSIEAINEMSNGKVETTLGEYRYYPSRDGRNYLSEKWQHAFNFDIHIPVYDNIENNVKIRVNFHIDGDNTNFDEDNVQSVYLSIGLQNYANLYKYSNYMVKDNKILLNSGDLFKVSPYSFKKKLKHEYHCMKKINAEKPYNYRNTLLLRAVHTLMFPFEKNKKRYLFMDRIVGAQDNAEVLWDYALNQKDGIKKYFVIDKESPDYKRLSKKGNVLAFGSFKHKLYFLLADKIISSHPEEDILNPFFSKTPGQDIRYTVCGLATLDRIFLQHGVIQNNLSYWLSKYDKNVKYFLTSSNYERDSLVENLSYPEEIFHVLGLPRFDNLENHHSKQILICPTWRFKHMGDTLGHKFKFLNSDYYEDLNKLLNNQDLINLAKENGCKLIFKPHPRLTNTIEDTDESYVDMLEVDENIEIAFDTPYNELLCNCDLMITDYSSVAFDFAYLDKPLIYFHPNNDLPHEEGYFKHETMGFGDVVYEHDELVKTVEKYIKNDFKNEEKYTNRIKDFYPHIDKNNCKRVYESIVKE